MYRYYCGHDSCNIAQSCWRDLLGGFSRRLWF